VLAAIQTSGDVLARFLVRADEAQAPHTGSRSPRTRTLTRAKIVDPSFLTGRRCRSPQPVAPADTIVRDFPLTTESFNLSYAGNDLWPARQVARARWEVASAAFAVTTHPGSRARR
jgi:Ni,Fe-hydrogenase III large subunit